MSEFIDVNTSVNKKKNIVNKKASEYLSVQDIATRAGVHPNTVRNKCLDIDPDESKIKLEGTKKVIEVYYAAERLKVDVKLLLTISEENVNKDVNKTVVNTDPNNVNKFVNKDVISELTNAKDEIIENLKEQIKMMAGQLSEKDSQINNLITEVSEGRNQSNVLLKNIQDNFLPIIESQQKLLESKEDEQKKKGRGWFGLGRK